VLTMFSDKMMVCWFKGLENVSERTLPLVGSCVDGTAATLSVVGR